MSGLPKLQELLDKAAFLKQDAHAIPDLWVKTWNEVTKILNALRDQVGIVQGILKDMNLDIAEIPHLDETLEKIAQICVDFQNLYEKNAPTFQSLLKILDSSTNLATAINFVYDVDTSLFGDHVWDVKKDKLFYGDFASLSNFIVNLHSFFSVSAGSSPPSKKIPLNNYLVALRAAGGQLLEGFLPGVVYRKLPEVVVEIGNIAVKIADILKPTKILSEHKYFEVEIEKARECLSILVVSEEVQDKKPVKLMGFLGPKEKGKDLMNLVNALQL